MLRHLRANGVAYIALFFGLTGASLGAVSSLVPANSVGTRQVIDHSLLKKDFKGGQLPRGPRGMQGDQGPQGQQGFPGLAGAANIAVAYPEVNPANLFEIKAFVPTGSSSQKCLVTLNEETADAGPSPTVYCGERTFMGTNGIFIHVFLNQPAPPNLQLLLTVYQDGAQQYGTAVLYTSE